MFAIILIVGVMAVTAQVTERRGTTALVEGRRYMVAFPKVWASSSEKPLPQPMVLFVSSRSKATITVSTPALINSAPKLNRQYNLEANKVLVIPISTTYMNEDSESRLGLGISVIGDKPISVSTYQAWMGNGELARHLPVEAWGKNYYSMNFYQDRYGGSTGRKYRPSQILVIASKDNTVVTYTPTFSTEGGRETPSVAKGASQSVTLEKGETYLILAKIDELLNKDFRSDLTGTVIKSSKPVGVVSGHTKVAIMRYPDVLPPTGMYAAEAHFVRNNVHDAMLPLEMAGTSFITTPCKYTATRVTTGAGAEFGIDDDKGDVVRVIALEDNTVVKAMRQNGSDFLNMYTLKKGESRLATSLEVATYWVSDKPVLMAQYGKSYAKILPPVINKGGDQTQGHPTVESGMPMMQYVASTDRYVNYAVFKSVEGMDNFFNIVFKEEEIGKIKIDGKALNSAFGGSMRKIQGSPYSYIATSIGAGDHVVESVDESVKWTAWSYGSLDGLAMGRAYGTPVAVDLSIPCDDSLSVTEEIVCGDVNGVGKILPEETTCGSIFAIYADDLNNYTFEEDPANEENNKIAKFTLTVIDKTKDASGKILVITRSGKFVERTYTYIADKIGWDPEKIDFGAIAFNTPVCKQMTLINKSLDMPVTILNVHGKYFPGVYTFNPKGPFVIPPGGRQNIEVCAVISDTREKLDTVIADLACFQQITTELRVRGDEPLLYVGDQTWTNIPASSPGIVKPVEIINGGKVDLIITGYDRSLLDKNTSNFFDPQNLDNVLPLTLKAGQKHLFMVTYSPKGDAVTQHQVDVPFYSNALKVDSIAVLKGNGVTIDISADINAWNERVIDVIQTNQGIAKYMKKATFNNFGLLPVEFGTPFIRGTNASAFEIVNLGDAGTFPIQLQAGNTSQSKYITVDFVPTELPNRAGEKNDYAAELVFPTNAASGELVVPLVAQAWQPQVKGADQDYGTFNVGDASVVMDIPIVNEHYQGLANGVTGDAKGTHDVVITDIRIKGAANGFRMENAPSATNPWRVSASDVMNLQVRFTPALSGSFVADYEIITLPTDMTDGAAPYTPAYKLNAVVVGGEFMVTGDSADQYVYNDKELIIKVRHTEAAPRSFTISSALGADASRFTIVEPLSGSIVVPQGQEGIIRVQFVPDYITKMNAGQTDTWLASKGVPQGLNKRANYFMATIDVTDDINGKVQTARVAGNGIYLETTDKIRDDYTVNVGKSVDVAIELEGTPEAIQAAGITQIRTRVSYDNTLIRPRIDQIVTAGTQTEGWTVLKVDQVVEGMIEIDLADKRATPVALTNSSNAPMFKVTFDAYLAPGKDPSAPFTSPLGVYSYWVDHTSKGERKEFTLIRDIPGKILVIQECARGMRLVSISSTQFAVKPVSPNPVSGSAIINYSIGLSGATKIALYNSNGDFIMDFVNENQAKGTYELTIDVSTIPSGTYFFKVISGPYSSDAQVLNVIH
ncbi:MAG: T9SS type A sorting domain-containing protein [Ignavibacteria bacterium]|nr:T9SS type A sorting domain-containing protein [Ignavibacteria bacterium]